MKIQLENISSDDNKMFSGIDTGISGTDIAAKSIIRKLKENGYRVKENSIDFWSFSGLKQADKKLYVYCPYMDGYMLSEILELPLKESVKYIKKLIDALELFEKKGMELFKISTGSVFFEKSGSIIFFPQGLISSITSLKPQQYRINTFQVINHPDLPIKENISFSIACILYKALTGIYPFYSEDEEELDSMKRVLEIIPPADIIPESDREISLNIKEVLNPYNRSFLSISGWKEKIAKFMKTDKGKLNILEKNKENINSPVIKERIIRNKKVFNKKLFWKRSWKKIAVQAGAGIIFFLIVFFFVSNLMKPRSTKDFLPEKLVEAFYFSANTLDFTLMDDCIINDAGKAIRNEVMNLNIIDKMQSAEVFNDNYIIHADEWVKNGKPGIPGTNILFGITGFNILENKSLTETEHQLKVQYVMWIPVPEEDSDSSRYQAKEITERLYLTMDRGGWVIYRIDRINESSVE